MGCPDTRGLSLVRRRLLAPLQKPFLGLSQELPAGCGRQDRHHRDCCGAGTGGACSCGCTEELPSCTRPYSPGPGDRLPPRGPQSPAWPAAGWMSFKLDVRLGIPSLDVCFLMDSSLGQEMRGVRRVKAGAAQRSATGPPGGGLHSHGGLRNVCGWTPCCRGLDWGQAQLNGSAQGQQNAGALAKSRPGLGASLLGVLSSSVQPGPGCWGSLGGCRAPALSRLACLPALRSPGSLAARSPEMHVHEILILDSVTWGGGRAAWADRGRDGMFWSCGKCRSLGWFLEPSFPEAGSQVRAYCPPHCL